MHSSPVSWRTVHAVGVCLLAVAASGAVTLGGQSQGQLTQMTRGKLEADLGNYAVAVDAFRSVADDRDAPAALRWEALVRLGLARDGQGDWSGSREAFHRVFTQYRSDPMALRFATGALAAAVPGRNWPGFHSHLESLLRTAEVVAVTDMGMAKSSKIVRLKWDTFELRAVWRPDGPGGEAATSRPVQGELAAYELDKMLAMDMVPPTVARDLDGRPGALQYWVNGVRVYQSVQEMPTTAAWKHQTASMSLFDNLIGNSRRVPNTMLVDSQGRLALIDHNDGFTAVRTLSEPPGLFDRRLVEKLRALDAPPMQRRVRGLLGEGSAESLLARRSALLAHLARLVAERGEAAVVF
ncbi:MAG: tetratricopeptide repeat protein [Acidobacteriota bacterium]